MTAFTDAGFRAKLKDLNTTQQSIQTISLWAIHHRKHSGKIVSLWMEELREAKDPARKLTLLYFANDVIQNMRRKGPEFQDEFRLALPEAMDDANRTARGVKDDKIQRSLARLVSVWRERSIFDETFLARLEQVLTGSLVPSPAVIMSPMALSDMNDSPRKMDGSLPKRIKLDADFQSFQSGAKKAEVKKQAEVLDSDDEDYEEAKINEGDDPPKLETLLRLIQKLQSAPSANGTIRSKIAELPAIITDPVAIDKLSDREEVDRLVKVAKDGLEMVVNYNKESNEELHDRQAVAVELARQLAFHRKVIEEKEKQRDELASEISKRRAFRDKLAVHVDSLPDMSNISASAARANAASSLSFSRTTTAKPYGTKVGR